MAVCVRFTRVIRLVFVSLIFVCLGDSISRKLSARPQKLLAEVEAS
jgi:hypothetical protein